MLEKQLYASVKAGFVAQHTSLNAWCKKHGIHRQNAREALLGIWSGKSGKELRARLIEASGIEVRNFPEKVANQSCEPNTPVRNS